MPASGMKPFQIWPAGSLLTLAGQPWGTARGRRRGPTRCGIAPDSVQPKRLTLGKQEASQEQQDEEQEGAASAGNCLISGEGADGAEHGNAHAVHQGQQQHKGKETRGLWGTASLQAAVLKQVRSR